MKTLTGVVDIREVEEKLRKIRKGQYEITKRYKMSGKDWTTERPYSHFVPNELEYVETTFRGKKETYVVLQHNVGIGFVTEKITVV